MRSGLPEIVGREHELAMIDAALRGALAGQGQVLLLSGEPGIGKTRLAQYASARAAELRMRCCWGRAGEQSAAPPYWPIRQIVRDVVDDEVIAGLGPAGADLAQVAPEAAGGWAAVGKPGEDRFAAFEAVTGALIAMSRAGGALVVLDDVQWADPGSIALLGHLVRGIDDARLAVVLTVRDTEPVDRPELATLLAELSREPSVRRLPLRGLTASEVARQLSSVAGRRLDTGTAALVGRRTQGNPFFVRELGLLLRQRAGAAGELPEAVRVAVDHRLERLPAGAAQFVAAAAVLGEPGDPAALAAVTGLSLPAVLEAVDVATRAGILQQGRFSHDLVAEVARTRLGTHQRLRLHARMAAYLAARADAPERAAQVAHHWLASLPVGEVREAVGWTERAAERATALMAWEEASTLLQRAAAAATSGDEIGPAARRRLLQTQAVAQLRAYDVAGAFEAVRAAAGIARGVHDAVGLAEAALTLEGFSDPTRYDEPRALCEQALAALPAVEERLRARLLARLAVHLQLAESHPDAEDVSARALRAAEHLGEPEVLTAALHARQLLRSGPDGVAERWTLGGRLLALGTDHGRDQDALWGRLWRFDALVQYGRMDEAAAEIGSMAVLAERLRLPLARWHVLRARAAVASGQGRFVEAAELIAQIGARARAARHPGGVVGAEVMTILLCAQTGADLPSGLLDGARGWQLTAGPSGPIAVWQLALGNLAAARQVYAAFPSVELTPDFVRLPMLQGKAELAAALGDRDGAADVQRHLAAYADHFVCGGAGALVLGGSVRTWLGITAATLDRLDDAVRQLRAAVGANDRAGLAPLSARSRLELARVLARRRRVGDATEASALAAVASAEAARMGMAPLLRWSLELAATLDGSRGGPLTRREREIADLVAKGLTNRQIAAVTHISERTVETHVAHCLAKLGVHSRARLASWVTADTYQKSVLPLTRE